MLCPERNVRSRIPLLPVGERRKTAMTGSMTSYMPVRLFTGKDCIRNNAKELLKYGTRALIVTVFTTKK